MLLLTSPTLPFLPPSLQEQLEEKIKNLNIQINKSKMNSDLGTAGTKLSKISNIVTKACKDLKENLENAEELLNQILIQDQEPLTMTMLAAAVPQDPKQMLGDCSRGSGGCIRKCWERDCSRGSGGSGRCIRTFLVK